jgi:hypothetical protein
VEDHERDTMKMAQKCQKAAVDYTERAKEASSPALCAYYEQVAERYRARAEEVLNAQRLTRVAQALPHA